MDHTTLIFFGSVGLIILIGLILFITIYNKLVTHRQLTQEGWSGIDVQLKRRANLIPNLVESVKGYMGHESGVLEKVTQLRVQCQQAQGAPLAERSQAEGMLSGALSRLFAVAEQYPDLKASSNFASLQQALSETEDQLQLACRYYNGTVRDLNIIIQSFPSNIVAKLFRFQPRSYFELTNEAERAVPNVKFN